MSVAPVFLVLAGRNPQPGGPLAASWDERSLSRTSSAANDTRSRNSCFKRVPHDREAPTNRRAVFAGWHGNGGFIPDWPSGQGRRRVWRSGCHDDREMLACDWPADSQAKASPRYSFVIASTPSTELVCGWRAAFARHFRDLSASVSDITRSSDLWHYIFHLYSFVNFPNDN